MTDRLALDLHPSSATSACHVSDGALLQLVERHVLPRLAIRSPAVIRPPRFGTSLSAEVPALAGFALAEEDGKSRQALARLHAAGASFAELQLGLLAPAARRLDVLWRQDDVSFVDVTLAAGQLQRMMRFVALDLMPAPQPGRRRLRILVAPTPEDPHLFGAAMAAEFFRRDGWNVRFDPRPSRDGLAAAVAGEWIDVVGLSLGRSRKLDSLRATIDEVRRRTLNPGLLIVVGGEAPASQPTLVTDIGADAALAALEAAPARAHRLVEALLGKRA